MKNQILNIDILACPECRGKLEDKKEYLRCRKCRKTYNVRNNIPIFIENMNESEEISAFSFKSRIKNRKFLLKLRDIFGPPDTNLKKKDNLKKKLLKNRLSLNIGSSSKKIYPNTINLDIGPYPNVDIVADGKKLPFKNESFDMVLIESVLEHIDEPEKVIAEADRVLKKGGIIYISIPFVFVFHGVPNDFGRYTISGLKSRLEKNGFKVKKLGVGSGPSSTLNQMLRYYLAMLFSFNSDFLFSFWLNVFGWLTFPIKYLDILLNKHKKAHLMASVIYGIGVKE